MTVLAENEQVLLQLLHALNKKKNIKLPNILRANSNEKYINLQHDSCHKINADGSDAARGPSVESPGSTY